MRIHLTSSATPRFRSNPSEPEVPWAAMTRGMVDVFVEEIMTTSLRPHWKDSECKGNYRNIGFLQVSDVLYLIYAYIIIHTYIYIYIHIIFTRCIYIIYTLLKETTLPFFDFFYMMLHNRDLHIFTTLFSNTEEGHLNIELQVPII